MGRMRVRVTVRVSVRVQVKSRRRLTGRVGNTLHNYMYVKAYGLRLTAYGLRLTAYGLRVGLGLGTHFINKCM